MKESFPNQSKSTHLQQPSNHSTDSTSLPNATESSSGISAILSPRNLLKFITKNIQEIASPRLAAIMAHNPVQQVRYVSSMGPEDVGREFGRYLDGIRGQMEKYRVVEARKVYLQGDKGNKQNQRELLQQQIKISKIPQQYFQQWKEHQNQQQQQAQNQQLTNEKQTKKHDQFHKSLKIQSLLMIGNEKKRSKQKRRPLYEKQIELQGFLDQIELVIFNKTRKYPDRYLHYLANLNNSDFKVSAILQSVRETRLIFNNQLHNIQFKQLKIIRLEEKKKKLMQLISITKSMRLLKKFKQNIANFQLLQKQNGSNSQQNYGQIIRNLNQSPKNQIIYKILSVSSTLSNAQELIKSMRIKKLQRICKLLHRILSQKINNMYSRQSWLKSQLPKDSLMIERMKPQVQKLFQKQSMNADEGNLNNSYLNISILDQSYCVASNNGSMKRQDHAFSMGRKDKETEELIREWEDYSKQYHLKQKKKDEQQQHIFEVFQRIILKFSINFKNDFQDYIIYIYNQSISNLKLFSTHKQRVGYLRPKLFNKITRVFFQALSTSFNYSIIFKNLQNIHNKLAQIIEQKIRQMVQLRNLSEYSLIQNKQILYTDVVQILNSLDYWFEYASQASDKFQMSQQDDDETSQIPQTLLQLQEKILNKKNKVLEQYLSNLHKFALTSDLKSKIQKCDFSSISIPVSSFSTLDFIINWGQGSENEQNNGGMKMNAFQLQQSFNYGSSFLADLQSQRRQAKKLKKFSIFKVIDKKLIIQGIQYKLCSSSVLLLEYLSIYLLAKTNFSQQSIPIDQRICQLIGFYIWYCRKMIFTSHTIQKSEQNNSPHQSKSLKSSQTLINRKNIPNLCMLINLCNLLTKLMDILSPTLHSKPKKVQKILTDLQTIQSDSLKQIIMIPFLQVEQQISNLYESRLKTRKQIPTKQSLNILAIVERTRTGLEENFLAGGAGNGVAEIRKTMENTVKIICKNYFGYLLNMEARGKAELKWFMPNFKEYVGDLFPNQISALEKQMKH